MLTSSGTALGQPGPEAVMRSQAVEKRLDMVESKVESLETLRSEFSELRSEFSQFRIEVRGEFSAVRGSMDETRAQMRMLHEEVLARFALLDEHLGRNAPPRRRAAKTDRT